jgi:hypothetical protein
VGTIDRQPAVRGDSSCEHPAKYDLATRQKSTIVLHGGLNTSKKGKTLLTTVQHSQTVF